MKKHMFMKLLILEDIKMCNRGSHLRVLTKFLTVNLQEIETMQICMNHYLNIHICTTVQSSSDTSFSNYSLWQKIYIIFEFAPTCLKVVVTWQVTIKNGFVLNKIFI